MMNPQGNLLIVMDAYDSEPEKPRILYDGGDKLIFYRNSEISLTLSGVDPEKAGKYIKGAEEITVSEIDEEDIAREYQVKIRIVDSLKSLSD